MCVVVVHLPLIIMETGWQSHWEHESEALGQLLLFRDRRGGRIPGSGWISGWSWQEGNEEGLFLPTSFQLWAPGRTLGLFQSDVLEI